MERTWTKIKTDIGRALKELKRGRSDLHERQKEFNKNSCCILFVYERRIYYPPYQEIMQTKTATKLL